MQNKIPHFNYRNKSQATRYFGCIESEYETIHSIVDLDAFYKQFGYTIELAKQGVLPDEYIWDTYFKNSERDCFCCYQLKMLGYLLKYSLNFANTYGHECDKWITTYSEAKAQCNFADCAEAKTKAII
jgi:hypothetical protein